MWRIYFIHFNFTCPDCVHLLLLTSPGEWVSINFKPCTMPHHPTDIEVINPSGAETKLFQENWVNTVAADVLVLHLDYVV